MLGEQLVHGDQKESRACEYMHVVVVKVCGNDLISHSLQWEARSLTETHRGGGVEHGTKSTSSSKIDY